MRLDVVCVVGVFSRFFGHPVKHELLTYGNNTATQIAFVCSEFNWLVGALCGAKFCMCCWFTLNSCNCFDSPRLWGYIQGERRRCCLGFICQMTRPLCTVQHSRCTRTAANHNQSDFSRALVSVGVNRNLRHFCMCVYLKSIYVLFDNGLSLKINSKTFTASFILRAWDTHCSEHSLSLAWPKPFRVWCLFYYLLLFINSNTKEHPFNKSTI